MENKEPQDSIGPIEYGREVVESTGDHQYKSGGGPIEPVSREQVLLSVVGLILALPFPILILILWSTTDALRGQPEGYVDGAANLVGLYLLQFFVIPVLSITSVVIAFIVTIKSKQIAKKIGYVSMAVTGVGLIILGIFLNSQK